MLKIWLGFRTFHTSRICMGNKAVLSALRKNTGYPFSNCKKALEATDYDLVKAEEWLKEQALKLGWAKAYKVADRSALQGLIGILSNHKSAVMVEVNCETDFVAKNSLFHNMVADVATTCFSIAREQNQFENKIAKAFLNSDELKCLQGTKGPKLEDDVALLVSQVGEKIQLRRALCVNLSDGLFVAGATHPNVTECGTVSMGKYGSLLVYKSNSDDENVPTVAKHLCQHVIGMKPNKIGNPEEDQPKENKEDETCLIHQEFLMDPEILVSQVLEETGISLVEFNRFERGEKLGRAERIVENMEDVKMAA